MAAPNSDEPLPDLLTTLPWPCQVRILQQLPLRSCLIMSLVCKDLNSLVRNDILRNLHGMDLNNLPGACVSDALSWAFRTNLPCLRSISAAGHACLQPLLTACQLPSGQSTLHQLTCLNLDTVKQLQDNHLSLLLPECPHLEQLVLPRCSKLTNAAALAVSLHLPRLRVAVLSDWSSLTDAGVCALARGCPELEEVVLE
ncbi:hypothetical protein Agub_g10071, partial [Astrephomene gubernaculifera]